MLPHSTFWKLCSTIMRSISGLQLFLPVHGRWSRGSFLALFKPSVKVLGVLPTTSLVPQECNLPEPSFFCGQRINNNELLGLYEVKNNQVVVLCPQKAKHTKSLSSLLDRCELPVCALVFSGDNIIGLDNLLQGLLSYLLKYIIIFINLLQLGNKRTHHITLYTLADRIGGVREQIFICYPSF